MQKNILSSQTMSTWLVPKVLQYPEIVSTPLNSRRITEILYSIFFGLNNFFDQELSKEFVLKIVNLLP